MKMKFCVSIVVRDGDKFLVVKDKDGKYNVPSGHIDSDDNSVVKAAQRELQEETGIYLDLEELYLVGNTSLAVGETRYHTSVFYAEVKRPHLDQDVHPIEDEDIVSSHWMSIREIDSLSRYWKNTLVMMKIEKGVLTYSGEPCFHFPVA